MVGSKKMVIYDDVEVSVKLQVYNKSVTAIRRTDTFGDFQCAYHYGDVVIPHLYLQQPPRLECLYFLECICECKPPLTDGFSGLQVVEIIEAA